MAFWGQGRGIATALLALICLSAACGLGSPERSVEAYCETLLEETASLEAKYQERFAAVEDDPLAGLFVATAATAEMTGDLALLSERLAEHAPEEVRLEHEVVAESMRSQVDTLATSASDPMSAIVASLVTGTANQASFTAVDQFALTNCGVQLFGSAPLP